MAGKIFFIADSMFPEAPLPDRGFAVFVFRCADPLVALIIVAASQGYRTFYHYPARGKFGVAVGQCLQAVQVIGQQNPYVDSKGALYPHRFDGFAQGKFSIAYIVRINNAGTFSLPPSRVEAMYAPDVFGEVANGGVVVGE